MFTGLPNHFPWLTIEEVFCKTLFPSEGNGNDDDDDDDKVICSL